MVKQQRRNWTRVWSEGYLTSCVGAFEDNYEGPIRAGWQDFFADLPAGSRVLDVATGNGAVALIAAEVSRERGLDLEIHGIDLADIDPPAHVPLHSELLKTIHFKGRTPAEHTDFDSGWFRAIASQYGVEYTDLDASLPELFRVLAPGGQIRFVLHHAASEVVRTSRQELSDARILAEETELFPRARALMEYVARVEDPGARRALARDPEAERLRHALNEAAARVEAARRASAEPEFLTTALNYLAEAWRTLQSGHSSTALSQLAASQQLLEANVERLADVLAVSRDAADMARFCERMRRAGFEDVQLDELRHDARRLMGWQLAARRPQ